MDRANAHVQVQVADVVKRSHKTHRLLANLAYLCSAQSPSGVAMDTVQRRPEAVENEGEVTVGSAKPVHAREPDNSVNCAICARLR